MSCPYLADAIHRDLRPRGAACGNVCFAENSTYWEYSAVDPQVQESLCATGEFQACPRLTRALASDRPYPAWVALKGLAARPWWQIWS